MRQTNSRPLKGRPKLPAEERKSILVSVKLDIDRYKEITDKAFVAGLNRSEYIRHAALHRKVVERLKPKDVKAIRDLQGIAESLNRNAKFISAIIKGGAYNEQFVRTYLALLNLHICLMFDSGSTIMLFSINPCPPQYFFVTLQDSSENNLQNGHRNIISIGSDALKSTTK